TTAACRAAEPSAGGAGVLSAMTASPPAPQRSQATARRCAAASPGPRLARQPLAGMLTHADLAVPIIREGPGSRDVSPRRPGPAAARPPVVARGTRHPAAGPPTAVRPGLRPGAFFPPGPGRRGGELGPHLRARPLQ